MGAYENLARPDKYAAMSVDARNHALNTAIAAICRCRKNIGRLDVKMSG